MTTGPARCLYALRPADRPGCLPTATVSYGGIAVLRVRPTAAHPPKRSGLRPPTWNRTRPNRPAHWSAPTPHRRSQRAAGRRDPRTAPQHHATWAAIASVLGTTRQAAQQRFTRPW